MKRHVFIFLLISTVFKISAHGQSAIDSVNLRTAIIKAVLGSISGHEAADGKYFSFILNYSRGRLTDVKTSNLPKCISEEKLQSNLDQYLGSIKNSGLKNGFGLVIVRVTSKEEPERKESNAESLDFHNIFKSLNARKLARKRSLFFMSFTVSVHSIKN